MQRYPKELKNEIRRLRSLGKTYTEIKIQLQIEVPKSSLSDICKNVTLPKEYSEMISRFNYKSLGKARAVAAVSNRIKKQQLLEDLKKINIPIAKKMKDKDTAKIALAMLCLGEASKSSSKHASFSLGSSDPRIVLLFIKLLTYCFGGSIDNFRCTVQCRADQNTQGLEKYWGEKTKIPKSHFYKTQVDPRTVGKPTKKSEYKGVLNVYYKSRKTQLDLESLADLVYNDVV